MSLTAVIQRPADETVSYFFKLCGNIADKIEPDFAKMEISGLFSPQLKEIRNFADALIEPPLNYFMGEEIRAQDFILRDIAYGRIQGFTCVKRIQDISRLIERLAYTREIYVVAKSHDQNSASILKTLAPKVGQNAKSFTVKKGEVYYHLFRFVMNTYFFENMRGVVYFSVARTIERQRERLTENVVRLVKHVMDDFYRMPIHPNSRVYKEVEDLFDERKEEKLYLVHGFGPPYKAKFHPRMIKALINYCGVNEFGVLDPFVGSGTTCVECALMGIPSIGLDISPVCIEGHVKPKIASLSVDAEKILTDLQIIVQSVESSRLQQVSNESRSQGTITVFLDRSTRISESIPDEVKSRYKAKGSELQEIYAIKAAIRSRIKNPENRSIFTCALCGIISDVMKSRYKKDVLGLFTADVTSMYKVVYAFKELRSRIKIPLTTSENVLGDVRDMTHSEALSDRKVSTIITSPPYSTAIDYIRNDFPMLEMLFNDNSLIEKMEVNLMGNPRFHDNKKEYLDQIRTDSGEFSELPGDARAVIHSLLSAGRDQLALRQFKFLVDMKRAMVQMFRMLVVGGKCIIIIGSNHFEVNEKEMPFYNAEYFREMATKPEIGFRDAKMMERTLLKTSYGAIQKENILILTK